VKKVVLALALLLAPALAAQDTGAAYKLDKVAIRLDGGAGGAASYAAMTAPPGCATTELAYFLGSPATLTCLDATYTAATKTLALPYGTVTTGNLTASGLATPGAITVTPTGTTGATTYTYRLVWRLPDGTTTEGGAASTTAAGHATLSASNYNALSWAAGPAGTVTDVYRTVGGATQGKIASGLTGTTLSDTGLAGGGETAPTVDGTGVVTGDRLVGVGTLGIGTTVAAGAGTATATIGGVIHSNVTPVATGGTSEEVLATYTLPANTLSADGKMLRIRAVVTHAANANVTTWRIRLGGIGGTELLQLGGIATPGTVMLGEIVVARTGSAAAVTTSIGTYSTFVIAKGVTIASGLDYTADIAIVVTGTTPTAAGDLTFKSLLVEVLN